MLKHLVISMVLFGALIMTGCQASKTMQERAFSLEPEAYLTVEDQMPQEMLGEFIGTRGDGLVQFRIWIGEMNGKYVMYGKWRDTRVNGSGRFWTDYIIKKDGNGYNYVGHKVLTIEGDHLIWDSFSASKKIYIRTKMTRISEATQ